MKRNMRVQMQRKDVYARRSSRQALLLADCPPEWDGYYTILSAQQLRSPGMKSSVKLSVWRMPIVIPVRYIVPSDSWNTIWLSIALYINTASHAIPHNLSVVSVVLMYAIVIYYYLGFNVSKLRYYYKWRHIVESSRNFYCIWPDGNFQKMNN